MRQIKRAIPNHVNKVGTLAVDITRRIKLNTTLPIPQRRNPQQSHVAILIMDAVFLLLLSVLLCVVFASTLLYYDVSL